MRGYTPTTSLRGALVPAAITQSNDPRQADAHRREHDDDIINARIARHHELVIDRLGPFVREGDHTSDVALFAETVAERLLDFAKAERQRRRDNCPEGFEHLVAGNAPPFSMDEQVRSLMI